MAKLVLQKEFTNDLWHAIIAVAAAIVVFMIVRGFGSNPKINETDHTRGRPRLDMVDGPLEVERVTAPKGMQRDPMNILCGV